MVDMRRTLIFAVFLSAVTLACGCVTLAPGADKVQITHTGSDVANCTAVGNIRVPRNSDGNVGVTDAERQFRNQVIGYGGNTGYVTAGAFSIPTDGIAYRCPQGG
jgi:hypothetical protein